MNSSFYLALHLLVAVSLLYVLYRLQRRSLHFGWRVLIALGFGVLFGGALQLTWGAGSPQIAQTLRWLEPIGSGYVRLLKLLVMPLVLVSISTAIVQLKSIRQLRTTGALVIALLLFTTAIAATLGAASAVAFDLRSDGLSAGDAQQTAAKNLSTSFDKFQTRPLQQQLMEIIPTNPFMALTGQNPSDTLSVVFLAALLGALILALQDSQPQAAAWISNALQALHAAVLQLVDWVLALSPYGILMLMTKFIAASRPADILQLAQFVAASYVALLAMFVVLSLIHI